MPFRVLCWSNATGWLFLYFSFLSVTLNHPSSLRIQMTWLHGVSALAVRPPPSLILCVNQFSQIQSFTLLLWCLFNFFPFDWKLINLALILMKLSTQILTIRIYRIFFVFVVLLCAPFGQKSDCPFVLLQLMTVLVSCQHSVRVLSTCTEATESSPPSVIHTKR